jgi:hypothetical protein
MSTATPQRTVTISLSGTTEESTNVLYSYWSPNDGLTRVKIPKCELVQKGATNTLFVLDYESTLSGWTITGTQPNPAGAPALEAIRGPAGTSIMTMFPELSVPQIFNFFIVFKNTVTGASIMNDPQEGNDGDKT